MSFDRNTLRPQTAKPAGKPFVNLVEDNTYIEGVFLGNDLTISRDFGPNGPTKPQIASDGKVRTNTIAHILLTDGAGFDSNSEDELVGQHVRYQIKGGWKTVVEWKALTNPSEGQLWPGEIVRITRTGTDFKRQRAGIYEFASKTITEAPSEEVMQAIAEVAENAKNRNQLDAEAKEEIGAQSFTSPQPQQQPQPNFQNRGRVSNSFSTYGNNSQATPKIRPF